MAIQAGRKRRAVLIWSAARFSTGRKFFATSVAEVRDAWQLTFIAATVRPARSIRFPRGLWGWISNKYDLHFFPVQRRLVLPPDTETDKHTD